MGVSCHFQWYFSYIILINFIDGGNQTTQRKPTTCNIKLYGLQHAMGRNQIILLIISTDLVSDISSMMLFWLVIYYHGIRTVEYIPCQYKGLKLSSLQRRKIQLWSKNVIFSYTLMVKNSTDINITNNHLSLQITEHKKKIQVLFWERQQTMLVTATLNYGRTLGWNSWNNVIFNNLHTQ